MAARRPCGIRSARSRGSSTTAGAAERPPLSSRFTRCSAATAEDREMASASAYRSTYASRSWSRVACASAVSPPGSASLFSSSQVCPVRSCSLGGSWRSARLWVTRRRPGSTNRWPSRICSLLACRTFWSSELLAELHDDLDPVVEQVAVADEDATAVGHRLARGALGVQQHVEPAGREVRRAQPVGVVLLLAADHLGRRPQHGREHRHGAVADRGHPPQAEEPRQARVLDHELVVHGEVAVEPLGRADPFRLAGRHPAGLEPGVGAGVADLDAGVLEQPVVVLDDPGRLAEALGVGLVGRHLGLRHVEAHQLHEARQRAGAAAAGAGHEQHLARVVLGLEVARRATASGVGGGAAHGWEAYPVELDRFAS